MDITKNHVIGKLAILESLKLNPMHNEVIARYKQLIENMSDKDFCIAANRPIKRDPQSLAEKAGDQDAWEWFSVGGCDARDMLLSAWK